MLDEYDEDDDELESSIPSTPIHKSTSKSTSTSTSASDSDTDSASSSASSSPSTSTSSSRSTSPVPSPKKEPKRTTTTTTTTRYTTNTSEEKKEDNDAVDVGEEEDTTTPKQPPKKKQRRYSIGHKAEAKANRQGQSNRVRKKERILRTVDMYSVNWMSAERAFNQLVAQHRNEEAFALIEPVLNMRPIPMSCMPGIIRLLTEKDLELYNKNIRTTLYTIPRLLKLYRKEAVRTIE
ncbi:hypothetical protein SAMD00019534_085430 [Acytostelium subglobosum LB1]|uniref:hypothetical protein n=1 Tax=Acytostelium subglobosum LB1 TaxID=1410327 RepID=UPI0006452303|nr:hypothetical protein SAMD00019534_085430 [Acytostelium subglobosum LB1]GAM25368.1 hypothetical protein SAMD00019534_085430 [Acytostelium subglobosum LB1]|eukprot:XP_012751888.1 hypothetical protein SAMD00019534_085430 [Acytostelium subglobosum LB1]